VTDRWEQLARLDPLFVVLAEGGKTHGRWEAGAFFETGRAEVSAAFERLADLGVRLPQEAHALDFGCGVGRLSLALSAQVAHVTGVDIAPRMIDLAQAFAADFAQEPARLTFMLNESPALEKFAPDSFDLVFTTKVLFHLKPALQERFLREFLRVLVPGGVLVFGASIFAPAATPWRALHARYKTVRRRILHKQLRFMLLRALGVSPTWMYERFGWRPMMPMYTVEERRLQAVLDDCGGETLAVDKELRRHRMNARWYVRTGSSPGCCQRVAPSAKAVGETPDPLS